MSLQPNNNIRKYPSWVLYTGLVILGVLVIIFSILVQRHDDLPLKGEYYYSTMLRTNFTWLARSVLFLTCFGVGYYTRLNPWVTGVCTILIFPFTAIYEASVFPGSHNLIPFEFIVFFIWALPGTAAVYLGRLFKRELGKRRELHP